MSKKRIKKYKKEWNKYVKLVKALQRVYNYKYFSSGPLGDEFYVQISKGNFYGNDRYNTIKNTFIQMLNALEIKYSIINPVRTSDIILVINNIDIDTFIPLVLVKGE